MDDIAGAAARCGIEAQYHDARGVLRSVPAATLRHLVTALEQTDTSRSTLIWRQSRTHDLPPPPALEGRGARVQGPSVDALIETPDNHLVLPSSVPPGVYSLRAADDAGEDVTLIVAPEAAFQPEGGDSERVWILTAQLYAVRSAHNWGHGDFTDLLNLVRIAAGLGAAGVGLNPLHALFEGQASPYSPSSRLFLNPLYIDLEALPEFSAADFDSLLAECEQLRATALIDYPAVALLKMRTLRSAYARFLRSPDPHRKTDFTAFKEEGGETLTRFAAFETLRSRLKGPWWEWPDEYRRPSAALCAELQRESAEEFGFHIFVQWVADRQLAACRDEAARLGMPIGLYVDLAVGVDPAGADAWCEQEALIPETEVGAPPDLLNTAGQAWGLAAFNPNGLQREAFAPFARLLSATMRHAGAVRLDHVLGLNRLYLIPRETTAADGAYLRYPLQELLAIVAMESTRHRCVVIGEDLGTVPDDLRGALADWGVWSYLVLLFERRGDGSFKAPNEFRRNALVTFNTHDLATFTGWLSRHDLQTKLALGIDPGETDQDRHGAYEALGGALRQLDLNRDGVLRFTEIMRYMAQTPTRMLAVALDDLVGLTDQPNIPGTIDQHPNWRRRLPVDLAELRGLPLVQETAQVLAQEGRAAWVSGANGGAPGYAGLESTV